MTSRQRMLTAMMNGIPDRVPVAPDMSNMIPCRLTGKPFWDIYLYQDPPLWRAYMDAVRYFGTDGWLHNLDGFSLDEPQAAVAEDDVKTETVIVERNERWIITRSYTQRKGQGKEWSSHIKVYPRADSPTHLPAAKMGKEKPPDTWWPIEGVRPQKKGLELLKEALDYFDNRGVLGVFVSAGILGSPEAVYEYYDHRDEVRARFARNARRAVDYLKRLLASPVRPDFILTGGSGMLVFNTPEIIRDLSLATLKEITRICKEAGIPSQVHCCGPERELVRMCAVETDLSSINPLEIKPMGDCDLAEIKRSFGRRLSLMGNLHTTEVMLRGRVKDVRRESLKAIRAAGENGGFILSTGDQCGRDTPDANIREMVRVVEEFGHYPLNMTAIDREIRAMERCRAQSALPCGTAAGNAKRVLMAEDQAHLEDIPMHTLSLNGTWSVRPAAFDCIGEAGAAAVRQATDGWIEARVPGEVHLDLMRAGQMPDPSVGANMPKCRWPEPKSWWYQTVFELDSEVLRHERQQLVFDGLDLYAQVFVNGRLAGESKNAFVPASVDVRRLLQAGRNELLVRLTAGSELALDETRSGQGQAPRPNRAISGAVPNPMRDGDLYGHRNWAGKKWLRKPQFSYGWDWVDALPNIGIWRGVRLECRSHAALHDLRMDTLRRDDRVALEMDGIVENLHPWAERACILDLEIQAPDGAPAARRRYTVRVPPGRMPIRDAIEIPNAQLWWPNGMGDQPLYHVTARLSDGAGAPCDERRLAIGLRTMELDRTRLAEGSRFCFRVNGHEVFCRGGNIGPHDAILARIPDAKYESLVAEAKNANMNMIRINGCSVYEAPAFYDACDRAGILVWHDFMLTCTSYPEENEAFCAAVRAEVEAVVPKLRHHPSIALWCGNNECTQAFRDWWNPDKSKPLDVGGQKLYNQLIPDLCRHLDPHRLCWQGSPAGGDAPNSELDGDCHWWGPFFMNADMNRRIRHETFDGCRARFVSEYGVIGPCHLDSVREYLAPEEMRPDSLAWRMHTNSFEKDTVPAAIRLHYADPEALSVPEYLLYGQMFQAFIHGYAMEALRFRKHDPKDDCQGALIWSYSDCWGETGWSILDYYLRRKASYYWFRRACAPMKVIVRGRGDRLVVRVVNDTLQSVNATVDCGWWRLDGQQKEVESHSVALPANSMREVTVADVPKPEQRDPHQWLYAAVLRGKDNAALDQSVWVLKPYRELARVNPQINVTRCADGWLEVSSPVFVHAVHTEDHGREVSSDNWFDLLPGVPVRVRVASESTAEPIRFEAVLPKQP